MPQSPFATAALKQSRAIRLETPMTIEEARAWQQRVRQKSRTDVIELRIVSAYGRSQAIRIIKMGFPWKSSERQGRKLLSVVGVTDDGQRVGIEFDPVEGDGFLYTPPESRDLLKRHAQEHHNAS